MFVGWIRLETYEHDLESLASKVLIDKDLLIKTKKEALSFGAYSGGSLNGIVSGSYYGEGILIHTFAYTDTLARSDKERLIKIFLANIPLKNKDTTQLVIAKKEELPLFTNHQFEIFEPFLKATYHGGAVFNFTNAMGKSISNENHKHTIKIVDFVAFQEDRNEYIYSLTKHSSLILSTRFGYMHSYPLDKNTIKLSPWIIDSGAFDDAEKLLRGVIYHRGLKTLIALIPASNKEAIELYENYNFLFEEGYFLLYKNKKPLINLEMVYGF